MGTDFVFASAFIKSRERKMIKEEQFHAMAESSNLDEICSSIQNAGYGGDNLAFRPDTYQKILSDKKSDMFDEIKDMGKELKELDILAYPNDYHNIKVLLKAEQLGVDRSDILIDKGTVSSGAMIDAVRSRSGANVTEYMFSAIKESAEVLARTKDPQLVDFVCDKYCFMEIKKLVSQSKNEFIKGYVRLNIDAVNLKTYIRVKALGQDKSYFDSLFIDGGNVSDVIYSKNFDADYATFANAFNQADLQESATVGLENLEKTGDYALFEKLCDDALVNYIRKAKEVSFGAETLFAYLVAKQMEIKNIRILMAGKIAGVSPEKIAERIRKTYE